MHQDHSLTLSELLPIVDELRHRKKTIVFTNGVFDILHAGHIFYLEKAKGLGDVLIVGINSDASVRRLKGKERPITNERERATVLAALKYVDYVIVFEEDTPIDLIRVIKPDIHVKGGDYKAEQLPEYKTVVDNGGKVVVVEYVEGKSTTGIIERIKML